MKRTGMCPKCQGRRVARIAEVLDKSEAGGVRHLAVRSGWLIASDVGRIEAYVCTECGYFEEYVADVEQVPWEEVDGFSWHS